VPRVETTDPEGVDYGWVMQVTFLLTVLVGAPLVALLSLGVTLPSWTDRALFAVRVGAVVWFLTALGVFGYARYREAGEGSDAGDGGDADGTTGAEPADDPE